MIKSKQAVIDVQADKTSVAKRAASWLLEQLQKSSVDKFALCLSGGQTPKTLYETLAQPEFANQIPWSKVHMFWGDERYVSKENDLSNYKMVKKALIDHIAIPLANIHFVNTDLGNVYQAAAAYEKELQDYYGSKTLIPNRTLFDVTFLGIGSDGHTASLFPSSEVLNEQTAWAKAVVGVKSEDRITLTLPVLQSSKAVAFLVTGAEKSDIIAQVLAGDGNLPAAKLKPEGNLYWFLDQTAYLSGSSNHKQ